MKLWIITQEENKGYDTYDSAVVCAGTKEEARHIHPGFGESSTWAPPSSVKVEYIGLAKSNLRKGVVVASFNAG